jgi:hypothetical protein
VTILKRRPALIIGENVAEFIVPPSFLAMVATPDISDSCWREVASSTNGMSNVNGKFSFQVSRLNGSKSSYAKHQGSPQVSMPSEKAISRGVIEFEDRENQLVVFLTEIHHRTARGLVECTGTDAGRFANCRRHH